MLPSQLLLEPMGPWKLFLLGLLGYALVGVAWLRYGDPPTYLKTVAETPGPVIPSPGGGRSARLALHEMVPVAVGLSRARQRVVLVTLKDTRRGIEETWALPVADGRDLSLDNLALRWSAKDRLELEGLTDGRLAFELMEAAE